LRRSTSATDRCPRTTSKPAWIGEHYAARSPVAAMVARSGLPERSFERRFRKATGMTPLA